MRQYLREGLLALRIGASPADALGLIGQTALFHLGNARPGRPRPAAPRRYRVRLGRGTQDLWLRTGAGDLFVLYEVFLSHCYAGPGFDGRGARLIVDLGANVGLASLYLAGLAPRARFVCVEPLPGNAALLRRNVAALPGARVVEAAVAGRAGRLAFDADRPAWGGRLGAAGRLTVAAMRPDEILDRYAGGARVDLLKVDVEGGEEGLFSGDLGWLDRVDRIVAELHPPFTPERFRAVLSGRGFRVYGAGEGGHALPTAVRAA